MVGELPKQDLGTAKIVLDMKSSREVHLDQYTREPIPHKLIRYAETGKLNEINARVRELSNAKAMLKDSDTKRIRARWVVTSKGDSNPDVRARLVAEEVSTYTSDEFFTSAQPLNATRLLLWPCSICIG